MLSPVSASSNETLKANAAAVKIKCADERARESLLGMYLFWLLSSVFFIVCAQRHISSEDFVVDVKFTIYSAALANHIPRRKNSEGEVIGFQ